MSGKIYDLIILGGGPAGLSAVIYARRANLDVLLIERGALGGQITQTAEIENYPGGIKGESGLEFVTRLSGHASSFGYESVSDEISGVDIAGEVKVLTGEKGVYKGRALVIATGNVPMKLGVPGEAEFTGRGVSYCATCDAPFFSGLEVYVVGGGDSAVEESLHLAKFARHVTVIHRRDQLRAAKSIQAKAEAAGNVSYLLDSVISEIRGGDLLESIVVKNVKTGETHEISANKEDMTMGVFIFIGNEPQTGMFSDKLDMENGYIITDENMLTGLPGVFAAGDVRRKPLRQVVTAAADGAIAAFQAERYLSEA